MGNRINRFWIACGLVFLVGGVWMVLKIQWLLAPMLAPILMILLGAVLAKPFVKVGQQSRLLPRC